MEPSYQSAFILDKSWTIKRDLSNWTNIQVILLHESSICPSQFWTNERAELLTTALITGLYCIFPRSSQTGPILSLIINSLFCHCSWKGISWTHLKMSTLIEASGKRVMRPDGHIHRRPHASAMLINSMQEASSKILGFQTPPWGFLLHTGTAWVGYSNHWREVQCSCQFDYPTPNGLALRAS